MVHTTKATNDTLHKIANTNTNKITIEKNDEVVVGDYIALNQWAYGGYTGHFAIIKITGIKRSEKTMDISFERCNIV